MDCISPATVRLHRCTHQGGRVEFNQGCALVKPPGRSNVGRQENSGYIQRMLRVIHLSRVRRYDLEKVKDYVLSTDWRSQWGGKTWSRCTRTITWEDRSW